MKTKGQAAMEFLMTYGWAILAAIIVIGVLAIYFRPGQLTSNSAVITAPLYATGSVITGGVGAASTIELEVKNNGGETIQIKDLSAGTTAGACTAASAAPVAFDADLAAGATTVITWTNCGITEGSGSQNVDVSVAYTRTGTTLVLNSKGTVTGSA